MGMPVSTWVEVDLDRFASNLRAVRALVGAGGEPGAPERGILLVVKADAYGHGAVEMAEAAAAEGVACLGVATLHEGIQLRQAGCRLPIVALSPLLPSEIREAVAHGLDPTVCDLAFARELSDEAVRTGRAVRCHVEVDTGMGRTGVSEGEAGAFLAQVAALPGLRLASLFTHFPDADAADLSFAEDQVRRFRALAERLAAARHPAAAAARREQRRRGQPARRALRLGARRPARLRPPPAQRPREAGPGAGHVVQEPARAGARPAGGRAPSATAAPTSPRARCASGVVAVGYGHGYSWLLSNRGHMLVRGRRVDIVGRVTMDLTMVDLTPVPEAEVGDDVVLFGDQDGDASLPLEEVAEGSRTLPYEIMCTIGKRVTRIYVRDGRPVKLTSLVGERAEWVAQAADHFRLRAEAVAAARRG